MKCPTLNCPSVITGNARRKYCVNCRASMRRHAAKTPRELLDTSKRYYMGAYRIEHIAERKEDFSEVQKYRRERRNRK